MLSLDKQEKFMKTLGFSKKTSKIVLETHQNSIKVDKNSGIEKLYNSLQKKYSLKPTSGDRYIKMAVKKQYF